MQLNLFCAWAFVLSFVMARASNAINSVVDHGLSMLQPELVDETVQAQDDDQHSDCPDRVKQVRPAACSSMVNGPSSVESSANTPPCLESQHGSGGLAPLPFNRIEVEASGNAADQESARAVTGAHSIIAAAVSQEGPTDSGLSTETAMLRLVADQQLVCAATGPSLIEATAADQESWMDSGLSIGAARRDFGRESLGASPEFGNPGKGALVGSCVASTSCGVLDIGESMKGPPGISELRAREAIEPSILEELASLDAVQPMVSKMPSQILTISQMLMVSKMPSQILTISQMPTVSMMPSKTLMIS